MTTRHVNDPELIREQIAEYRSEHPAAPSTEDDSENTSQADLVFRGQRVITPAGMRPREVAIHAGRVVAIEELGAGLSGTDVIELAEDEVLIPGLVDTHVHVNEPGREDWEGFATATKAAAAGGVTTIIDMPLNSIPSTVNVPALEYKQLIAEPQAFVDVGFWGGAVPGNIEDLRPLHEAGVFGVKCFLLHSGVEEFAPLDGDELEQYLTELERSNALMIVHAENSSAIDRAPTAKGEEYGKFLASRPRGAENLAISEVIERARWTKARVHILHLSSSDALPMIRSAKSDGVNLTVETCPHYLTLMSEEVPNGNTAYKCCPPIREAANRELLWEGLLDGTIDYIASDHSPSTLELKDMATGDFGTAWGGVASVQVELPVIWTEARRRGVILEQVIAWMATLPADRVGVSGKGRVEVGFDADMAIFAPDDSFVVDAKTLYHRNPITPYDHKPLSGVVRRTWVRGKEVDFTTPHGRLIKRGER